MCSSLDESTPDLNRILLLDHGYVRLVDSFGSENRIVDAARASFTKQTHGDTLTEKDMSLLRFLVDNGHTSPFRHCILTFEMKAPMMVVRQIQRYVIGTNQDDTLGAWNEASYRYISQELEFHVPEPDLWRGKPDNAKQGSKGYVDEEIGSTFSEELALHIDHSLDLYNGAIDKGIAPEQARLFLPANAIYVTWYLTMSLQALAHMLKERLDGHAMYETRIFAQAMYHLSRKAFPIALDMLLDMTE